MMEASAIDNLEVLVSELMRLIEAEDLAREVYPQALPEIRDLHDQVVDDIIKQASAVLGKRAAPKGRTGLHGGGPKISLELLERYFEALKHAAQAEWMRSQKLSRKEARESRRRSEHLAQLANQAALAIRVVAQARGEWTPAYRDKLEIDPWL